MVTSASEFHEMAAEEEAAAERLRQEGASEEVVRQRLRMAHDLRTEARGGISVLPQRRGI